MEGHSLIKKSAAKSDNQSLPRLCYIGDVPVEASYHGSALLYRLLQKYPAQNLLIVEQSLRRSMPTRRLANVRYEELQTYAGRFLYTRFNRLIASYMTVSAERQARHVQELLGEFQPEALLTVAHGFSWLAASAFARRNNLPIHVIYHDDWPQMVNLIRPIKKWMNYRFKGLYQHAASRLCVSPVMVDEYQRRYGLKGTVLYPARAHDALCFDKPVENDKPKNRPFTLAFAGSLDTGDYVRQLCALSRMIGKVGGRLLLFGPFEYKYLIARGIDAQNVVMGGLVKSAELIRRLRDEADVLFLPESFEEAQNNTIDLSFPSKLTDYTATALPILMWGPKLGAAIRWAESEPGVAAIVTEADENVMAAILEKLASDQAWRRRLGAAAAEIGKKYFSAQSAQTIFYQALC